jgi:hypothetical protein
MNGPSIGELSVEVAAKFASQVGKRGEDAADDDVAFDLGKTEFDLIEPGGISRGEVKAHSTMFLQELTDSPKRQETEIGFDTAILS